MPGKYGELVRWCTDATIKYFLYGNPSTKRPEDHQAAEAHRQANKTYSLVTNLCDPFLDKTGEKTGDRFFSSFDTASELLRRNTLVHNKKNRRDIPPILHEAREKF